MTQLARSILASLLLWALASFAAAAQDARISDDVAVTKAIISSLAAKDFTAVRDRLDPSLGKPSDDTLDRLSKQLGAGEPASVETIWTNARHSVETGDGSSQVLLEYGWTGRWVVVEAVVKTEGGAKRFTRLYFTVNTVPLRELNAFHLFGKGPVQYLFFAGWLVTIGLTVLAMIIAFRRHAGWRRWVFIVAMPAGLTPTLAVNWNSGQLWVMESISNSAGQVIPLIAFRYPMVLYGTTELLVPYLYISAPLFAFGYLIWYWLRGRQPAASPADQAV
jgi:hypothetical protein